jgi:DNA-binding transcriptional ArsR family regulator
VLGASELLGDRATFLSLMEDVLRRQGRAFDRSIWETAHRLLNDPPAMQDTIVTHLRTMWDEVLASEWERNLPMLEDSIAAFQSLDLKGLTAVEALGRVALRTRIPQAKGWLEDIEHFIFIPSAHTGPYIVRLGGLTATTARILFGARIPDGVPVRPPSLTRSELLMRLNALADDTRLRILELLAQRGETGTPDIIAQLTLSQSSASRHLEHLTANGYLTARRHRGTNLYQLNRDRIDYTFKALKEFCQ